MGNTYKDKALALFDAGFEPIPLKGKRPVISDWTTIDITRDRVGKWAANGMGGCNVGIRCTKLVQAIDIDVDDERVSYILHEHIRRISGFTIPISRVGKFPRRLFPCHVEGITGKLCSPEWIDRQGRSHKIEVLTVGQQFAAYGGHPTTGKDYEWFNGLPETVGADKLPRYKLADIGDLFETLRREAVRVGWKERRREHGASAKRPGNDSSRPQAAIPDGDEDAAALANLKTPGATIEELREALFSLPQNYRDEREYWIEAGMIVHWETGGSDEGFNLWDEWSRSSAKYGGTKAAWKSFKHRKPAEELATFGTLKAWLEEEEGILSKLSNEIVEDVTDVTTSGVVTSNVTDETGCHRDFTENVTKKRGEYGLVTTKLWSYIQESDGELSTSMIYQDFSITKPQDKNTVRVVLKRLCEQGKLEKVQGKRGYYAVKTSEFETLEPEDDDDDAQEACLPIALPFGLHKKIKVLSGSVMIVYSNTNGGKTGFAFQIGKGILADKMSLTDPSSVREELRSFAYAQSLRKNAPELPDFYRKILENERPIRYINVEMPKGEIKMRTKKLGKEMKLLFRNHIEWGQPRRYNWSQVIEPDRINILDYLQIYDDFYRIGQYIADIHSHLNTGIAIILIQKKTGEANPRGGEFALERARIAFDLEGDPKTGGGVCKLRKVKAPIDYNKNPQGMEIDYRFTESLMLEARSTLRYVSDKERKALTRKYEEEMRAQNAADDFFENAKDNDEQVPF